MTLMSDSLPTNGSAIVLNTCAVKLSLMSAWRMCIVLVFGLMP